MKKQLLLLLGLTLLFIACELEPMDDESTASVSNRQTQGLEVKFNPGGGIGRNVDVSYNKIESARPNQDDKTTSRNESSETSDDQAQPAYALTLTDGGVGDEPESRSEDDRVFGSFEILEQIDKGSPDLTFSNCEFAGFECYPHREWRIYATNGSSGRLKFKRTDYSGLSVDDENYPFAIDKDKVEVNGTLFAKRIEVIQSIDLPDYVFDDNFDLMSLEDLDEFVTENHHLPGIPSEADVIAGGGTVSLGDSVTRLLQKVEELTLYTIEQNKQIKVLQTQVNALQKQTTASGN